jgi:hypothetical protein
MRAWDRQPGESEAAHRAALSYFDLGADRSIQKLAGELGHRSKRHLEEWSRVHRWVERAEAFDAEQRRLDQEARDRAREAEAAKWAEREEALRGDLWQIGESLLEKARGMLLFPLQTTTLDKDGKTIVEPARWNFRTAAAFVDLATKLQQLAANRPTEISDLRIRIEYEDIDPQAPATSPGAEDSLT